MCDVSMSISRTLSSIFIVSIQLRSDSDILFKFDSDVTQMYSSLAHASSR